MFLSKIVVGTTPRFIALSAAFSPSFLSRMFNTATSEADNANTYRMDSIPSEDEGYKLYKRSPTFNAANIPKILLTSHNTKAGTWGKIIVERGEVKYTIFGPPERIFYLTSANPGVVKPRELHKVEFVDPDTEFHVDFYATSVDKVGPPPTVPSEVV